MIRKERCIRRDCRKLGEVHDDVVVNYMTH